MFGIIDKTIDLVEEAVDDTANVASNALQGELPSADQITNLVETGISIAMIAELTGTSVDVLQEILNKE